MVQTLRIAGVLAAIVALALLALLGPSFVYGSKADPGVQALLGAPGILDQFRTAAASHVADQSPQSPLVEQANRFSKIIDPPPAPQKTEPAEVGPSKPIRPVIAANFQLMATSYNSVDPNQSFAFIDAPGGKELWVRKSQRFEHWTVVEIKDGVLIYNDGQADREMRIDAVPMISLIDDPNAPAETVVARAGIPKGRQEGTRLGLAPQRPLPNSMSRSRVLPPIQPPNRPLRSGEVQDLQNLIRHIQDRSDALAAEQEPNREQLLDLEAALQEVRMSQQEAQSLGDLGSQLDINHADVNGNIDPELPLP